MRPLLPPPRLALLAPFLAACASATVPAARPLPAAPSPAPASRLVDVTLGVDHGCVRRSDGTVACWGSNEQGQLGTGDHTASSALRTVAGLPPVRCVHAFSNSSCAVALDDRLWCWGAWPATLGSLQYAAGRCAGRPCQLRPVAVPRVGAVADLALDDYRASDRAAEGSASSHRS